MLEKIICKTDLQNYSIPFVLFYFQEKIEQSTFENKRQQLTKNIVLLMYCNLGAEGL